MKSKIVITGLPGCNKTLLAVALAIMTNIPYIRNRTMYEWQRWCKVSDPSKMKWKDMFLIASASFFERAVIESYYDRFISDGASFSELIWLKSGSDKQFPKKTKNENSQMIEYLEFVTFSHAAGKYDFIIHIDSGEENCLNDTHMWLYTKHGIPYKVYGTEIMEEVIKEIANDLQLPMLHTVENAIYQAKKNVFQK